MSQSQRSAHTLLVQCIIRLKKECRIKKARHWSYDKLALAETADGGSEQISPHSTYVYLFYAYQMGPITNVSDK